jgi:hypothetical protein
VGKSAALVCALAVFTACKFDALPPVGDDGAPVDAIASDGDIAVDAAAVDGAAIDAATDALVDAMGCGDSTRNGAEVCDGSDLASQTCQSLGFSGGTLACATGCAAFDMTGCASPPPPVQRKPINHTYYGVAFLAGSLRPTFEWTASTWGGTGTISYELDMSTDRTFGAGVTTVTVSTTSYRPAVDMTVSTTVPVGTRYFWRVRACFMGRCSANTMTRQLNLGRSNRDLNGDGYADIVVGAPASTTGRAYVFFGGAGGGVNATPDGTLVGQGSGDAFGNVSMPGDLNGDGYADVAVGAYRNGATDAGRVYVYFGGMGTTFNTTVDATINGSGASAQLSASAGGDINADGYSDLIVGAVEYPTGPGSVYVYLGGAGAFDTTADAHFVGAVVGDELGTVLSSGDVNGDGYADVIAGAPNYDGASTSVGAAYVYLGSPTPLDTAADVTLVGGVANDYFGLHLASAGDVNGDGADDLVVGAHEQDTDGGSAGRAYVYYGTFGGVFDTTPDGIILGTAPGAYVGTAAESAGDVNNDGFADVVVGAVGFATNAGRVYVFLGGNTVAFNTTADAILGAFSASNDQFGYAAASAGDVNGDGFADVVAGAPFTDAGGADSGTGFVFFGAAGSSFDATADGTLPAQIAGEQFSYWMQ